MTQNTTPTSHYWQRQLKKKKVKATTLNGRTRTHTHTHRRARAPDGTVPWGSGEPPALGEPCPSTWRGTASCWGSSCRFSRWRARSAAPASAQPSLAFSRCPAIRAASLCRLDSLAVTPNAVGGATVTASTHELRGRSFTAPADAPYVRRLTE